MATTAKFDKIGSKQFRYEQIDLGDLSATDLREVVEHETRYVVLSAYVVTVFDPQGLHAEPTGLEALCYDGRTGIASGADSDWFDSLGDIETDIDFYLNGDPDDIAARN